MEKKIKSSIKEILIGLFITIVGGIIVFKSTHGTTKKDSFNFDTPIELGNSIYNHLLDGKPLDNLGITQEEMEHFIINLDIEEERKLEALSKSDEYFEMHKEKLKEIFNEYQKFINENGDNLTLIKVETDYVRGSGDVRLGEGVVLKLYISDKKSYEEHGVYEEPIEDWYACKIRNKWKLCFVGS